MIEARLETNNSANQSGIDKMPTTYSEEKNGLVSTFSTITNEFPWATDRRFRINARCI
jgi:hypothetical protein